MWGNLFHDFSDLTVVKETSMFRQSSILHIEYLTFSKVMLLSSFFSYNLLHQGFWASEREYSWHLHFCWFSNMVVNCVRFLHILPERYCGQMRKSRLFLFNQHCVWSKCHTRISVVSLKIPVLGISWLLVLLMW